MLQMNRHRAFRGMETTMTGHVWIFVLFFLVLVWMQEVVAASGNSGLPRPSLTVNSGAKVFRLKCKPPPEVHSWDSVHDMRVFWSPGRKQNNVSLVTWTSTMDQPHPGEYLSRLAEVLSSGSFDKKNPFLWVSLTFSSEVNGKLYCTMEFTRRGIVTSNFSSSIDIGESFTDGSEGNSFEVSVIPAQKIAVTWRTQGGSDFTEARVQRIYVDKDGREMTAPRPLFITSGKQNLTFEKAGFLLAYLDTNTANDGNYTLTVFVQKDKCEPACIYSSYVAHKDCYGENMKYCYSRWKKLNAPSAGQNTDTTLRDGFIGAFTLCAGILTIFVVRYIVLYCRRKHRLNASNTNDAQGHTRPCGPDTENPSIPLLRGTNSGNEGLCGRSACIIAGTQTQPRDDSAQNQHHQDGSNSENPPTASTQRPPRDDSAQNQHDQDGSNSENPPTANTQRPPRDDSAQNQHQQDGSNSENPPTANTQRPPGTNCRDRNQQRPGALPETPHDSESESEDVGITYRM